MSKASLRRLGKFKGDSEREKHIHLRIEKRLKDAFYSAAKYNDLGMTDFFIKLAQKDADVQRFLSVKKETA